MAQKVTQITRSLIAQLNTEIKEALAVITEKHGLTVEINGGSFEPAIGYSPKLKLTVASDGGVPADFKHMAPLYGLTEDDYGKEIRLNNGQRAKITGINTRRPKYPISVMTADGKGYKMTEKAIQMQLRKPSLQPLCSPSFE